MNNTRISPDNELMELKNMREWHWEKSLLEFFADSEAQRIFRKFFGDGSNQPTNSQLLQGKTLGK
jgi:hypothetical protein